MVDTYEAVIECGEGGGHLHEPALSASWSLGKKVTAESSNSLAHTPTRSSLGQEIPLEHALLTDATL